MAYILRRGTQCARCRRELMGGDFIGLIAGEALCIECAGWSRLEFLPSGDVAVTRRAVKYSTLHVVVLKKSAARKRSERQGVLAEPEAIRRAEAESAADAEKRTLRQEKQAKRREQEDHAYVAAFAEAVLRQYPGCPAEDAHEIAVHACQKYSGRVGRSAAAKQFDPTAIRLAVVAHVRHKYTHYDRLLARYGDRQTARDQVQERIAQVLGVWEGTP